MTSLSQHVPSASQPVVSIVIPCYNDGKYVLEAHASARAQTYPHVEILVIDDHSTDPHTLAALDGLRAGGALVLTSSGKGVCQARNTGIRASNGKYILPLDADDVIHPEYVERAVPILEADPEIGICYCKAHYFGLKKGPWRLDPYSPKTILFENMIFISSVFRKQDWSDVGGFSEDLTNANEDHDFWIKIIARGKKVFMIDDVLFYYRIKRKSRQTYFASQSNRLSGFFAVYKNNIDYFTRHIDTIYGEACCLYNERRERERMFSWKLFKPLFILESKARFIAKRLLGRA